MGSIGDTFGGCSFWLFCCSGGEVLGFAGSFGLGPGSFGFGPGNFGFGPGSFGFGPRITGLGPGGLGLGLVAPSVGLTVANAGLSPGAGGLGLGEVPAPPEGVPSELGAALVIWPSFSLESGGPGLEFVDVLRGIMSPQGVFVSELTVAVLSLS